MNPDLPIDFAALTQGFVLSFGLIVAIGAQNAFVLRQGLRREQVGAIVLFCALADLLLMAAGVFGMAHALREQPTLTRLLAIAGACFLFVYGVMALRRARRPGALKADDDRRALTRAAALAQAAAFTLLNPHVYLDTVLLVGSVGAQHTVDARPWFVAGAGTASIVWFTSLGYGARWLAPWFARPRAWQVLDGLIGVAMLGLAAMMVNHALTH